MIETQADKQWVLVIIDHEAPVGVQCRKRKVFSSKLGGIFGQIYSNLCSDCNFVRIGSDFEFTNFPYHWHCDSDIFRSRTIRAHED